MVDATIYGAGIFGLSIAWACLQRGARVQVIDPAGPGAGASGGVVGTLAPHVPDRWNSKKAFQLDSLLMAPDFWRGVTAAGGVSPGYARTGRVQPIANDRALNLAHKRAEHARALWQGRASWRVMPVGDSPAWQLDSPTGYLIHDTLSARIHPRQACQALVAALAVRGVTVVANGKQAGVIVWATGAADLDQLSRHFGRTVGNGIKGQAAVLKFEAQNAPQLFVDALHIVPHANGTVAIGSTTERDFAAPCTTDARLDAIIDRARAAVPDLQSAPVLERWAGLRPRTKSRAPILGPHPLHPGQFIANGGFKIGFGMASKCAEVMADLILDGRDAIPDEFRPEAAL